MNTIVENRGRRGKTEREMKQYISDSSEWKKFSNAPIPLAKGIEEEKEEEFLFFNYIYTLNKIFLNQQQNK